MRKFLAWVAGILGTVIGGVLLLWLGPNQHPQDISPAGPTQAAVSAIDFLITDELGNGQVTERVVVVVDGRSVGTLTVDTVHRTASLTVTVPRAGLYEYELSSTMVLENEYETTYERVGYAAGQLQVTGGRSYTVVGDYNLDPVALALQ